MDARKTFLFEECHMSYHSLCCVNFSFKLPCFVFYCIYLVTFPSFVLLHFVPLCIVISFLIDHFRLVLCTFQFPFSLLRPYIAHISILFSIRIFQFFLFSSVLNHHPFSTFLSFPLLSSFPSTTFAVRKDASKQTAFFSRLFFQISSRSRFSTTFAMRCGLSTTFALDTP